MKYEVASDYAKLALDDVGETNKKTTKLGQMRTEVRLKELCARFTNVEGWSSDGRFLKVNRSFESINIEKEKIELKKI
ncbi:hypothetical protein ACI65C_001602 [Semiaphis heraclei]